MVNCSKTVIICHSNIDAIHRASPVAIENWDAENFWSHMEEMFHLDLVMIAIGSIIDSHHHFWDPSIRDYAWMTARHTVINRAFSIDDLRQHIANTKVTATVLVQTCPSVEETKEFLQLAGSTDLIAGIVGWVDLTSPAIGDTLTELVQGANGSWLKGIRHQVHNEADPDWLLRDDVQHGLQAVSDAGLVYDLLIRPREIKSALRVVKDLPALRFVVNHIAKPDIAHGEFARWSVLMEGFAEHREHVWCKLSGMITEADWVEWSAEQFVPYVKRVLEIFGPDRAMFGSDWPVCLLAASYEENLECLRFATANLAPEQLHSLLFENANQVYRLGLGVRT